MEQSKSADKRKFPRISKEILIEVSKISYPLSHGPGEQYLSKNISGGGVCFCIDTPYDPEAVLSLKLSIPGWKNYKKPFSLMFDASSDAPLTAIGEVAWCRKLSGIPGYDVGVKFVDIYEDDYHALINYLGKQDKK